MQLGNAWLRKYDIISYISNNLKPDKIKVLSAKSEQTGNICTEKLCYTSI